MNKKEIHGLLYFTTAITILSQIESLKMIRPLMYGSWIVLIILLLVFKRGALARTRFLAVFSVAYFVYILFDLICSFYNPAFLENHYLKTLLVPFTITFTCSLLNEDITKHEILTLCKIYVLGAISYAIYVNIHFFSSYKNWLSADEYIFVSKNSAAQIWCTGILICVFLIAPASKNKILWHLMSFYLLFLSAISQCRTALLAMFTVVFVNILLHSKKNILWVVILIASIFILYNTPFSRQFIEHAFLLDKYVGTDLNTMSSGRIDYWNNALELFKRNPLIGVGSYYVDSSYVMILTESGIVGFLLIEGIWISRIVFNFKHRNYGITSSSFVIDLTTFYIVESVFEGYPPFGPGVSSFMFWLLSAYLDNYELLKIENDMVV